MSNKRLLYASNVSNVAHLDYLLKGSNWKIFIMRPWVPKKWLIRISELVSEKLSLTLRARENDLLPSLNYVSLNLGVGQFYAPTKNLIIKSPLSQNETIFVNRILAHRVVKKISKMDVVITTRDIYPKFQPIPGRVYIAEMRELHPNNLWSREVPIFGYPYNAEKKQALRSAYAKDFENIKLSASGLMTYSSIAKDSFIANGYPANKIFVFPLRYPVIASTELSTRRTSNCLFVGRDDPNKGLDLAVLASLEAKVHLKVVGHYSSQVINWMKNYKHVEYIGPVNRTRMRELMSSSHALLAPSLESYGLAVIEALESGCLVVSSQMNGAAATFGGSPNVFCAVSLDLSGFTKQLHDALEAHYIFNEEVRKEDFPKKFDEFIDYLGQIQWQS